MVDRQESRDRFERFLLVIRTRFMEVEDAGIAYLMVAWAAMQRAWGWANQRPDVLRWVIVFGGVTASMVVGFSLRQNVTASSQLLLLLPAVLISGLYGGQFAGVVAALLGAVATIHWKMSPIPGSFAPDAVGLLLYAIACTIVLGLCRAQHVHEEQASQFAETLEERVQERTADLESANKELLDFCYSISHDLRAPMRNLVGSSRILLEESGTTFDSVSQQRLQGIANSANKLSEWVDDLLHYAKLGHTEIRPEWVNVTQIVDDLCAQIKEEEGNYSSVTVRVNPNLVTTGDRVLIRMAMRCILENAYKYAKKGQPLVIEIGERLCRGANYISIRDNGIGFEQQYAKRIFEPFQRLHRDCDYPGSGIGLANVKRIVERHGGAAFAEGAPMIGATFLLRFGSGRSETRLQPSESR